MTMKKSNLNDNLKTHPSKDFYISNSYTNIAQHQYMLFFNFVTKIM